MIDKAKTIKEAQKFMEKGQIDKAIAEWKKVADAYPDGNTYNMIGDLYFKAGNKNGAVEEYHKAAKIYTDEGFSLKALAIHKKVLNLNPRDAGALIALGQLNEEKNIIPDAIKFYLAAADVLSKENKKEELLQVYAKILKLAPKNVKLRIKVSELFSKEGFIPEAAKEYCNIAELFTEMRDEGSAVQYLTKAFEIQPGNKEVLLKLSDYSESKKDFKKAAEYLQMSIERTGEDTELMLRVAHLQILTGKLDEASAAIAKVLKSEPGNYEARKQLADLYQKKGDIANAWIEYKKVVDDLISAERLDEAMQILVAYKDFDVVENRRKLVTIHKMLGDEENAFNELYALHSIFMEKDFVNEAMESLKEALSIRPDNAEAREQLRSLEAMLSGGAAAEAAAVEMPAGGGEAPSAPSSSAEKPISESLNEVDVFFKYGLYTDAKPILENLKANNPDNVEVRIKLKQLYKEMGESDLALGECIDLSKLYREIGDIESSEKALKEATAINPTDPRLAHLQPKAPAKAAQPKLTDHTGELSEADFFIEQGLFSEAAEVYKKLLGLFPNHPDLTAKLARVEQGMAESLEAVATAGHVEDEVSPMEGLSLESLEAPEAAPADIKPFAGEEAESMALGGEEAFDFSSILDEAGASAEPTVEGMDDEVMSIFDEFKKGLAQEIEAEDSATHYDLGIAYKEMGILDDSIKEFQVASRDPKYFSQSTTMIGLCYMAKGQFDKAAGSFSAALMKSDATDDKRWSLKYDLALAYEKSGKLKDAYQLFTEVYNWDSTFRDVTEKYETLRSQVGGAPTAAATRASDTGAAGKKSRVSYI